MTMNHNSATSILQRVRRMFSRGYEKLTIQELKTARFVQTKFPRVGYQTVRIVFSLAKLVLAAFLIWLALWMVFFIFAWFIIKNIDVLGSIFTNNGNESRESEFGIKTTEQSLQEPFRYYDDQGNSPL